MQRVIISSDASCNMDKQNLIAGIFSNEVVPLLKFHFKVLNVEIEGVFVRIYIDVEGVHGVKMSYIDITDYCTLLTNTILWNHNIDVQTSVYTG